MGGAWDSTNTADGDVAVFAPIDIDHADRLGETIAEIAAVKAGIIKDGAAVVSARQDAAAEAVLRAAAADAGRHDRVRGRRLRPHRAAPRRRRAADLGARSRRHLRRTSTCRCTAGTRASTPRSRSPPWSRSSAAPRSRSPATSSPRASARRRRPAASSSSASARRCSWMPRTTRMARARSSRPCGESFDFDEWGVVLGILDDKDAAGIVAELAPVAAHVFATAPESERASDADRIADLAEARGSAGDRPRGCRGRRRGGARAGRRHPIVAPWSSRARCCSRAKRSRWRPPRTGRPGGSA